MAGRHHRCNEYELGQTSGDGEGQGGLACCSPWGCKELDMTGQLNNWDTSSQATSWEGHSLTPSRHNCPKIPWAHSCLGTWLCPPEGLAPTLHTSALALALGPREPCTQWLWDLAPLNSGWALLAPGPQSWDSQILQTTKVLLVLVFPYRLKENFGVSKQWFIRW